MIRRILAGPEAGGEVAVGVLTEGPAARACVGDQCAGVEGGRRLPKKSGIRMTADCLFFLQRRYLRRLEQELRRAIRVAEETRDDKVKKREDAGNGRRSYKGSAAWSGAKAGFVDATPAGTAQ